MKETLTTNTNYKDRLWEVIQRDFPYLIMGLIVVISAGTFLYFQLSPVRGLNVLKLQSDEDIFNREAIENSNRIASLIEKENINYISENKVAVAPENGSTLGLTRPEENGQISAVASDKVTYTKNKYTVEEGDSLASIAGLVYGDREAWVRIAEANGLIDNPDAIYAGMILIIPR